jgi:uncharacterized protein (TIGR03435 family)
MSKFLLPLTLIVSLSCSWAAAQQTASAPPAYDVVTIKVNNSLERNVSSNADNTSFLARNVTLKHLLVNAYGIREGLISGLPAWASTTRFDVDAKVTGPGQSLRGLSMEQRQAMLAVVLADRFHLKSHTELKTLPVYELVIMKDGSKLTPSTAASPPKGPAPNPFGTMDVHNGSISAEGVAIAQLAGNLSFPLDRTVIDRTGLTGRYDFRLRWTPDTVAADNAPTDAPPDLFTAIQEQLGLKLQPAKGPVETLVIDHVELPTEN